MGKGGLLAGAAFGYNQFSPDTEDLAGNTGHFGRVKTQQIQLFGQYGVSTRINLIASLPVIRWSQFAEHEDAHHRTETLWGLQDLNLGARYIISNSYFGPGSRIFAGVNLSVPTAPSYKANPFSEDADLIDHRHFALGAGTMKVTFTGEWWHRSEFPWVLGLTSRYSPEWLTSDMEFRPGHKMGLDLHAIGQAYKIWRGFPYLTIRYRWEGADHWADRPAPNSGGFFLDVSAGLDLELSEKISGVVRFHTPLWFQTNGSQQSSSGLEMNFRFVKP